MTGATECNKSHWNEVSSSYNSRFAKTIEQVVAEIQKRKDWIGVNWAEESSSSDNEGTSSSASKPKRTVKLLDYACGTGLVSRALAPYVTQCVGIDLTPGMVNEYNSSVSNQGIPSQEMYAYQGNLIDPANPSPSEFTKPEFQDFDIAVVGLGFHHFDDPKLAAKRLAERLKKGGVLMIVDFLPHEHMHGHKAAHTVTHMGFSEEDTRKMFEEAGVGSGFDYVKVGKGIVFGEGEEKLDRSVFFARGSKL